MTTARYRTATNGKRYIEWAAAGGPNECAHGYAAGIPCPKCDGAIFPGDEREAPEDDKAIPDWIEEARESLYETERTFHGRVVTAMDRMRSLAAERDAAIDLAACLFRCQFVRSTTPAPMVMANAVATFDPTSEDVELVKAEISRRLEAKPCEPR